MNVVALAAIGLLLTPEPGFELLGKAAPDECFAGIGQPYPAGPPCATGQAKVNHAYVWGMTRAGGLIWFGTGANTHCLTTGYTIGDTDPVLNEDYVCEYGESQVRLVPPALGDVRPPQVWTYDPATRALTDRSAAITNASAADARRLRATLGMRAAGAHRGVILLGGPSATGQLNLFAFDAVTERFLGSRTLAQYGNARTFLVADGDLYAGVGLGLNGNRGGAVLRWTGSRVLPFAFQEVAQLPNQAADLASQDGRLYTTTWAATGGRAAGVWRSPELPLGPADAGDWTEVFNVGAYEPDPLTRATYGLGGVASYQGWLYWGTMHVPLQATTVHQSTYPQPTEEAQRLQVRFTQRATSVWRGRDLGLPTQRIELLYGEPVLPAYEPSTGTWSGVPTGWTALYGRSGFGNTYNNYTWRMAVAGDRLHVGTMDWSYLVQHVTDQVTPDPAGYGADLWTFPSADAPAQPVTTTGGGNQLNYGFRTLLPDGDGLYLGSANPMNLRTDPAGPMGGWELLHLSS
ncbi:hypothetical protein [Actinoplanes sp. RD1]|uniref:hypothetical protein n=1 Tax=Actinoplanes sp. RD1 TaxID=3064538 RepID=UPI00274168BB|nr:hypothetical protein [Actinoplanes sp. RD1]